MTNATYGKLTAGLIGAWFIVSLTASALHVFNGDPSRPPLAVGLAVVIPIALFLLWFAISKEFRLFALGLNPRTLTLIHTWRTVGFTFLVLATYGILPSFFALPAGWGDIAIGATAPFAALMLANPSRRGLFVLWQALGILDLLLAVGLGTAARLIEPHGITTNAMSVLPMSLIPTFAVPLLLILHIICIAQARQWPVQSYSGIREQIPSPATR
jgi:hypothetical protein